MALSVVASFSIVAPGSAAVGCSKSIECVSELSGVSTVAFGKRFASSLVNLSPQCTSWGNVATCGGRKIRKSSFMLARAEGGESVVQDEQETTQKKAQMNAPETVLKNEQLAYDGPGQGGQWLSATTRHVRIYVGVADPVTKALDQSQLDKLTLMLDPDNEFVWPDDKVQKVYDYFTELVEGYAGAPCTEYTLRLIGSDIEHYIRKLLLANEIKYNLECGVLNFSMGQPRYDPSTLEGVEETE